MAEGRLYELLAPRPYLNNTGHHLHHHVKECRQAIAAGTGDFDDILDRLNKELEVEQEALARAFKLFDTKHTGSLDKSDIKNMNKYLGFPAEDRDVDGILAAVDIDKSGHITFDEFETYVGKFGGMSKLFEERQRRITERLGARVSTSAADMDEHRSAAIMQAGIDKEAEAYWKMVVPPSEFIEAAKLVAPQAAAVKHIRTLAKKNHQEALPKLQTRLAKLGYKDDNLWLTLAWIRELAPILVHLNLDKILQFMESDTHYRNQFETASSGGLLKPEVRKKWERDLFGGKYDMAEGFERPKYGVQNVMNDYRGVVKCKQYGDSYVILKDVRLRCTFAPEDSANLKANQLAVLDFYAHVLSEYSDPELVETLKVANSAEAALLGDSDQVGKMKYKEAQIHGEVAWASHCERLVAHTRHRDTPGMEERLKAMCAKHGMAFSWMDEENQRMRQESMHKLGGGDWKQRMAKLQETGGTLDVPEGYCKVGCGRKVAPGQTASGNPFSTCCRGCVMGFGHDRLCGQIDASKVGPGLCRNGCGRKVAPGQDAQGRPLTTCCRACALGLGHDKMCQQMVKVAEGMCKMNCGRKVAPGTTRGGRAFDTCCKECAQGKGHGPNCIPPPAGGYPPPGGVEGTPSAGGYPSAMSPTPSGG